MAQNKYAALFEDEEDVFLGSPKSKFMDVVFNANNDVVRYDLEQFIDKVAVMELMLEKCLNTDNVDAEVERFKYEHEEECETKAKSLYVELMGSILSKSE